MGIKVEVDEDQLAAIDRSAEIQGITRATAIRMALARWIQYNPKRAAWSQEFLNRKIDPDPVPFEIDRPGPEAYPPDPFSRPQR